MPWMPSAVKRVKITCLKVKISFGNTCIPSLESSASAPLRQWQTLRCTLESRFSQGSRPLPRQGCLSPGGTWPPSGGEVLWAGQDRSSCPLPVPALCWGHKRSRITPNAAHERVAVHKASSLASQPKKMNYLPKMSAYGSCPWCRAPFLSQFSKHCSLAGLLLPFCFTAAFLFGGRKGRCFWFGNGAATLV